MTAPRHSFHQAALTDLEGVLALVRDYYAHDAIPFDGHAVRAALAVLLAEPLVGRAWLIRGGTEDIGYVVLTFGFDVEFGGHVGTVTDLYLKAPYRGQGLGRAALTFVERYAAHLGLRALELQATATDAGVLAFYGKLGFERHSRIPLSKRLNNER